jgi:hypothetical protein
MSGRAVSCHSTRSWPPIVRFTVAAASADARSTGVMASRLQTERQMRQPQRALLRHRLPGRGRLPAQATRHVLD